jgi:acyl carrier protein
MKSLDDIRTVVHQILRDRGAHGDLQNSASLVELGFDSVTIAEVLLDCEQRLGTSTLALLDGEPISIDRLCSHLQQPHR